MSSRVCQVQGEFLILSGDTFMVRDKIKSLGGKWNAGAKHWMLPHSEAYVELISDLGFVMMHTPGVGATTEKSVEENAVASSGQQQVLNVSTLLAQINALFKTAFPYSFWISGEIVGLKKSNGHIFFELAEPDPQRATNASLKTVSISSVLWEGRHKMLREKAGVDLPLQNELQVKLCVHLDLRRDGSRVTLVVDDIDTTYTFGLLALSRENIIKELRKRGLYDRNRMQMLSYLPLRIALVTAEQSRAKTDFVNELEISKRPFSVTLFDTNMQGDRTEQDITLAMSLIEKRKDEFDVVVITRGGGSRTDLRWFDQLEIAKSIAYCSLPVVTAIGHFEDSSVADEVAFYAEKTPTGAARFLVNAVNSAIEKVYAQSSNIALKAQKRVEVEKRNIAVLQQKAGAICGYRLERERQKVGLLQKTVQLLRLTLIKPLSRGYVRVLGDQDETLVFEKLTELRKNDTTHLQWVDREQKSWQARVRLEEDPQIKGQ